MRNISLSSTPLVARLEAAFYYCPDSATTGRSREPPWGIGENEAIVVAYIRIYHLECTSLEIVDDTLTVLLKREFQFFESQFSCTAGTITHIAGCMKTDPPLVILPWEKWERNTPEKGEAHSPPHRVVQPTTEAGLNWKVR